MSDLILHNRMKMILETLGYKVNGIQELDEEYFTVFLESVDESNKFEKERLKILEKRNELLEDYLYTVRDKIDMLNRIGYECQDKLDKYDF